jgi:membrane protease YdiL (CAAX protease family)
VSEALRPALALLLAAAFVLHFDRRARARGLEPPGFADLRRHALGSGALVLGLAVTSLAPLTAFGAERAEPDYAKVPTWALFANHGVLLATIVAWYAAGFLGTGTSFREQFGLVARRPGVEIALGALVGLGSWILAISAMLVTALVLQATGAEDLLPKRPPGAIGWIVGLPFAVRAAVGLSAGFFEELFFRGLLQPRVGIVLSTALFAVAHLAYGQPLLVLGVTVLSLVYGMLVRWRQNLWAAISAHAFFDLVQLLIVVPTMFEDFQGFWSALPRS